MQDELQVKHFDRLAELIESHAGIRLPPSKRTMVEGRLRKRVRTLGLSSLREYGDAIFQFGKLEQEFPFLVDCVTTNKTDFFREPDHFEFLVHTIIPSLLKNRPVGNTHLKFWSAAASIGAEAYTIAMVAAEFLQDKSYLSFSVLGTDICTDVLRQASRAIYPVAMIEPVPPLFQQRYTMRSVDSSRREVRIVPEIRRLVHFKHLNLMDSNYPVDRDIDVIFCRNILIYFDKERQEAVLGRLSRHLRPGGYLILGHSESLAGASLLDLHQVAPTVFCKKLEKAE